MVVFGSFSFLFFSQSHQSQAAPRTCPNEHYCLPLSGIKVLPMSKRVLGPPILDHCSHK